MDVNAVAQLSAQVSKARQYEESLRQQLDRAREVPCRSLATALQRHHQLTYVVYVRVCLCVCVCVCVVGT